MNTDILLTLLTFFTGATTILTFISNRKKDNVNEGKESGSLKADLQYIKSVLIDVRNETKSINNTLDIHTERLTRVEESTKQAHKRLNEHEKRLVSVEEKQRGN